MNYKKITISNNIYKYGEDYYYHKILDHDKQNIIFQTSYLWLIKEPHYIKKNKMKIYFFNLSFFNLQQDSSLQILQKDILNTETKLLKWINKKYKDNFEWYKSFSNENEDMLWNITSKEINYIKIFDSEKKYIDITQLKEKQYIRLRIHLEYIWFKKNSKIAGINYRILQIQTNNIQYISSFSFHDQQPIIKQQKDPVSNHPIFAKYFKMLTMGIPKQAIKQKMNINKLPEEIIDLDPNQQLPEKYNNFQEQNDTLTQSLSEGITLSKCEPIQKKTNENKLIVTQEEINAKLKSLKPIIKQEKNNKNQNIISILTNKYKNLNT